MKRKILAIAACLMIAIFGGISSSWGAPVGLELALVVDVSGSISNSEFTLQRTGYANAFNSAAVVNAILGSQGGSIAATLIYWSGAGQEQQAVPWTLINSAGTASAFATAINNAARPYSGNTGLGEAIQFTAPLFFNNSFEGLRQVMDVSGDGTDNSGALTPAAARAAALALGVDTINGLVIGTDAGVLAEYTNNVIAGTGAFVDQVSTFAEFGAAIEQKLIREVVGVPEVGTMFLLGAGLLSLLGLKRKIKK